MQTAPAAWPRPRERPNPAVQSSVVPTAELGLEFIYLYYIFTHVLPLINKLNNILEAQGCDINFFITPFDLGAYFPGSKINIVGPFNLIGETQFINSNMRRE